MYQQSKIQQLCVTENLPAFTVNLVLLKCRQMSCVFSFIVRVAVCMVGGSVCVLFDDIKYVSDVAETIAQYFSQGDTDRIDGMQDLYQCFSNDVNMWLYNFISVICMPVHTNDHQHQHRNHVLCINSRGIQYKTENFRFQYNFGVVKV